MKIVLDVQGIQGRSSMRGIGRYSFEILKGICERNKNESIFFLANSELEIDSNRRKTLEKLAPNATWVSISYPIINGDFTKRLREVSVKMRKEVIDLINPDWVHVCSIVEGFNEPVVAHEFGSYKSTCIFFDAIPAIYPEEYLKSAELMEWYKKCVSTYKHYDSIFAISDTARQEAVDILGLDPDIIQVIWGGINEDNFDNYYNIDSTNILYCGAFDSRKNLPRLLEAFQISLPYLSMDTKLILIGNAEDDEYLHVASILDNLNISDRVIVKGYLSELELDENLKSAKLLVLPSLHEGLGLPLLEAMSKGIPAIASKTSSMASILQNLENTFNPLEIESISECLISYTNNVSIREQLVEEFFQRRGFYTWQNAVERMHHIVDGWQLKDVGDSGFSRFSVRKMLENLIDVVNGIELNETEKTSCINSITDCFERTLPLSKIATIRQDHRLNVSGHFSGNYSLSQLNRELSKALSQIYPETSISPEIFTMDSKTFTPDPTFFWNSDDASPVVKRNKNTEDAIVIRNTFPPIANDMNGNMNLFHTYNWEESEFPQEYIDEFNYFLDGISFASKFVQKVLLDSGLRIPSRVTGAASAISDEITKDSDFLNTDSTFTFLHISSGFPRKGIDVLLKAFGSAFSRNDDVRLVVKTFPNIHNNVEQLLEDFKQSNSNHASITLVNDDLPVSEIVNLYKAAHCVVQPSRGEGFGLTLWESLSFGKPVIATNWGGHRDFVSQENGILIDFELTRSKSHLSFSNSLWAEPSTESLAEAMKTLFFNRKDAKFNPQSWKDKATENLNFIRQLSGYRPITAKTAWVSTFNTRCGIAEYTKGLLTSYSPESYLIFPPVTLNVLDLDTESVCTRVWSERGELRDLEKAILATDCNVVIIQHNWGFYQTELLNKFIEDLSKTKVVFIELHSLRDSTLNPYPELLNLLPGLLQADRVIIHDSKDLNLLKKYGVDENTVLIPLAFPDPVHNFEYEFKSKNQIVIATSGFVLPNKNQEKLIEVATILTDTFDDVILRFYCPVHTDPSSLEHLQLLETLASRTNQIQVEFFTEYLSDTEILTNLSNCDVVIYAYGNTGETSSASVRHGISSGTPVVVTPSPIFDSARDFVFTSKDYSPQSIAEEILILQERFKDKEEATIEAQKTRKAVSALSRTMTSNRILGMSEGILNVFD